MIRELQSEDIEIKLFKTNYIKDLMKKIKDYYSKYRKHNFIYKNLFI